MIIQILNEMNKENGSNYKIEVLKKYNDNDLFKRLLKMTYDRVDYNFYIGKNTINNIVYSTPEAAKVSLESALDLIESNICNRNITGNSAKDFMQSVLSSVNLDVAHIIIKMVERDLKIGVGRTSINKANKNLIKKPIYMRCDIYGKKTDKNIKFPAIIQLKADGTYREAQVSGGKAQFQSRSGEEYSYPLLNKEMESYPDGVITGEITVKVDQDIIDRITPKLLKDDMKNGTTILADLVEKFKEATEKSEEMVLPRALGNGILNSDDVPHEKLIFEVWDFITFEDYVLAGAKDKNNLPKVPYSHRLYSLTEFVSDDGFIRVIESHEVQNLKEALSITSEWMMLDKEGGVLKDNGMLFKDGTSKQQLKLKLEINLEVRCTGLKLGGVSTKNEGIYSSFDYSNDEGTIKGNCANLTDDMIKEINEFPERFVNKVFEIQCNDITQASGNDFYALSHPRLVEFRRDKDETDTLERAIQSKEMSMELS